MATTRPHLQGHWSIPKSPTIEMANDLIINYIILLVYIMLCYIILYIIILYYIILYIIILYIIILYYIILYYSTILNIILYYIYMYLSRLMGIFSIHKYTIHCDKGFWGFSRHRSLDCKIDCLVSSFKHSLVPSSSPSYDPIPDFPIGVWNHQDLIGFDGEPWGKMTMPSWNSYLRQVFVTGSCRAGSAW